MNSLFILLATISASFFGDRNVKTVNVTCTFDEDEPETCIITDENYKQNEPNNFNILNADDTKDVINFRMVDGCHKVMPLNLFQLFPNLVKVEISTGLAAISKENFIGGNKLKELILSGNKISAIEAHTFDGMDELELIDLDSNKLTKVESNAFAGAIKLKNLDLRSNKIVTIEHGAFNIPTLEDIDLYNNNIVTLADDVFVGCPELKRVSLYANEFTRIGKSIDNVAKLNSVSFSNGELKIEDFDFYAIARKPQLEKFVAQELGLVLDDPASAAHDNYAAEYLDINGNDLSHTDILHRLRNFRNLKTLILSENDFTTIDDIENILDYFPKLKELKVNKLPGKVEIVRRLRTKFGDKIKSHSNKIVFK
ncbi:hypothetical protein HA402_000141 [Bradysia odoriphaga]|nr:hypothetical protein HA402_000141 [Bradysia odoriphaga]